MARRYELTPKQFALIEDLLPARSKRGGRWNDHHTTLNGIFWWLYSGAQWREVPARYGKWQSIYDRFNYWRADGTLDRLLARLHLRLNEEGRLDYALWSIDATKHPRQPGSRRGGEGEKTGPMIRRHRPWAARVVAGAPRST